MSKPSQEAPVLEFSTLLKPVPAREVLDKMARTDSDIARLKAEGFEDGRKEGHAEGLAEGLKDGFEQGHRDGYSDGMALKQKEVDAFHAELERVVSKVDGAIQEWFTRSEPALAQLSLLIAQRILARELVSSPESVLAVTREALSEVTHATSARIRINAFDSGLLQEHKAELLAAASSVRQLELVEDDSILGGCIIETEGGVVDARIEMKLAEIIEQVRRAA